MTSSDERKVFQFILEIGVRLNAKSTTTASASVLCYKFLHKMPSGEVSNICPYTAAASCMYLAGKLEEDLLKVRDITNVSYHTLHPNEEPLEVDELYWDLRDGISKLELLVIRTLGFHLSITHPHKFLLHYLRSLEGWLNPQIWQNTPIARTAWAILRDSYICPKFAVHNSPQMLALAALYISLQTYCVEIPYAENDSKHPWWNVLYDECSTSKLMQLANNILVDVYDTDKGSS